MSTESREEYSYSMLAKLLIVFLIVHLLAVITLILMFSDDREVASSTVLPVTSVWCAGSDLFNRKCHFKNLCYAPKYDEFVFVHGNGSMIHGLPETHPRDALVDLSGGVLGHGNRDFYFNYVDLPAAAVGKSNLTATLLPTRLLIFRRFKPDNLMHVFHDDLIPLFFTMQDLEYSGVREHRLFFVDDFGEGPYWTLYRNLLRSKTYLNSYHPLLKSSVRYEARTRGHHDADLICFQSAQVGGLAKTRWYHYGYGKPQGAVNETNLSGDELRLFAMQMRKLLEVPKYDIDMPKYSARVKQRHDYAVILTRKTNRRILNEAEIALAVSREFDVRALLVDLETQSLSSVIHLLQNCTLLIGMHGAGMSLAMFLPVNAVVVELFPYGISPENYTPYKTMAELPGMRLIYRSWQNQFADRTKTHPEYPSAFGGISALSGAEQQAVIDEVPVKPHECCSHPAFLFRIYQDTDVDVPSLVAVIKDAFGKRDLQRNVTVDHHSLCPAEPRNITCRFDKVTNRFVAEWQEPWNIPMMQSADVRYELRIQDLHSSSYKPLHVVDNVAELPEEFGPEKQLYVWVSGVVDGTHGPVGRKPGLCKATSEKAIGA